VTTNEWWKELNLMSPAWNLFDLLPSGRGESEPDNTYPLALPVR
jgi:hypothetical protein